jgi:hypothetical protein
MSVAQQIETLGFIFLKGDLTQGTDTDKSTVYFSYTCIKTLYFICVNSLEVNIKPTYMIKFI